MSLQRALPLGTSSLRFVLATVWLKLSQCLFKSRIQLAKIHQKHIHFQIQNSGLIYLPFRYGFTESWALNMVTKFCRVHRKIQLQDTYGKNKAVILTLRSLPKKKKPKKTHKLKTSLLEIESQKHKFVAVTQVSWLRLTLDF